MAYQPTTAHILALYLEATLNHSNSGALYAICKDWHQYMERTGVLWGTQIHSLALALAYQAARNQFNAEP